MEIVQFKENKTMTKDETLTAFNALFASEKPDPLAIEKFRTDMLSDYDTFETNSTALETFKTQNEELTKTNKSLQEVNMKLIMLHPESINTKSNPAPTDSSTEESTEPTDDEKQEALDKVLAGFGHKKE